MPIQRHHVSPHRTDSRGRKPRAFISQLVLGSIAIGALSLGVLVSVTGSGQATATVLDELSYQRVERLRQTMAVTDSDLAAMGVSPEQSEVVIKSVLAWSERNAQRLAKADRAVRKAEAKVRGARRALQSGDTKDKKASKSYARLSADLAEAEASRVALMDELESGLAALLKDKEVDWAAAKLNAGRADTAGGEASLGEILRRSTEMRLARQGVGDDASLTAGARRYRLGLKQSDMIAAVAGRVYQPPVKVKPLEQVDGRVER